MRFRRQCCEVALLPAYCKNTTYFRDKVPGGMNSNEIARWTAAIGPEFIHLHHYCFGLMNTNRAVLLARDGQVRLSYLAASLLEFDYVIQRSSESFVLLPEILTKKGENLIRLGKAPVGILELERAADLKPDYWPPYAQLSDYYKSVGDRQKAKEALDRGLSSSPDAQPLRRRLSELGTGG